MTATTSLTATATAARAAAAKNCPECGGEVPASTRGKARVFCSNACKQNHGNRMAVRGKSLAKVALGWRQTRGSGDLGKYLFAEMTAMLDAWNAEDREAGRGRADDYAAKVCEFRPLSETARNSGAYGDATFLAGRYMDRR